MAFSADWTDECQVKALTEEEIRADERRRCRVICMERAIAWRTGAMGVAPNPDSRAYEAEECVRAILDVDSTKRLGGAGPHVDGMRNRMRYGIRHTHVSWASLDGGHDLVGTKEEMQTQAAAWVKEYESEPHWFGESVKYEAVPYWGDEDMEMNELVELCAQTAHEVNRVYCQAMGDESQVSWEQAPEWQKQSARTGVRLVIEKPEAGPDAQHAGWLEEKLRDGWKYGPVKDPGKKEHPCCMPYYDLPKFQRTKDVLFGSVVRGLLAFHGAPLP